MISPETLIEVALLTQADPLSEQDLCRLVEPPLTHEELTDALANLKVRWQNRALQLVLTAQGWRFQIVHDAFVRLSNLQEQRAPRYSRAVLETLAIIAYQQPVTRGDIESIRGVTVSPNIMQTLQERGWIEIIGQRDSIGKPSLWATTAQFLQDLQLKKLSDLPPLTELTELVLPDSPESSGNEHEI